MRPCAAKCSVQRRVPVAMCVFTVSVEIPRRAADFLVGESIEVAEEDDFAAPLGQGADGGGEDFEFLPPADQLRHAGPLFQDARGRQNR